METSEIIYVGDLRTEAVHLKSGNKIITDAPVDNQGKGHAFSPTDLLATSLGNCMLTIMGIYAKRKEINMSGAVAKVTKIMGSEPRRVTGITVEIEMPEGIDESERKPLENAALTCPVAKSLHPDLEQNLTLKWK